MSSKTYIAAYGTLRRGYGNSRLVDKGDNLVGIGRTVDKYKMIANGIPYVTKDVDTNITVDVWEVDDIQLSNVDRLEGHPSWYKRELIDINIDDTIYNCWLYFNSNRTGAHIPSGDFKDYR